MEKFVYKQGITDKQIEDLILYSSSDELVKTNTGDPVRFKDRESFEKWKRIPREIYTLTDNFNSLLGIVWFRTTELPQDKEFTEKLNRESFGITFAIRIYGKARGKGYSEKFLNWAFQEYKKTNQYLDNPSKGVWLETRSDNLAAIKLYEKFGFKTLSNPDENNRIIMTQS